MIYRELPFGGGGTERAPERFFAKAAIRPRRIVFIENVHIPGIHTELCVDLYEEPIKEECCWTIILMW